MRNTDGAISWYKGHETKSQLGFDPDGMCLRICRTARGIDPLYPTAVSAQEATPAKYRVTKVRDIRRGMVAYYDDPNDSNPYGHIVTVVGRVKGEDRDSLRSLLVRTNSVKSDQIVVVRGDYFPRYWGDRFQFAATWLNGQPFPDFEEKPPLGAAPNLREAIKSLEDSVAYHKRKGHTGLVKALERDIAEIKQTIRDYS